MRQGKLQLGIGLAVAGLWLATMAASPAWAQNGRLRGVLQQRRPIVPAPRQAEKPAARPNLNPAPSGQGQPNLRGMAGLPPKWVENLQNMTPDEQERFMQNDARFTNLPPERQQQIRKNLENWNKLTLEQQADYRRREAALEQMTPSQRQYFLNVVGPKYQALPPDRKQLVNRHLNMLSHMGPDTQQAALSDPKFMQDLSADEQDLVRNLNALRNPPTE